MKENDQSSNPPKRSYFGNRSEFVIAALFYSYTKVLPEKVTIEGNQITFNVHTEREKLRCLGRNFEAFREIAKYFNQNHVAKIFDLIFDPIVKRMRKKVIHEEVIPPKKYYRILIQVNGHGTKGRKE